MSGTLSLLVALQLAQTCAGGVAPETLLSFAKAESNLNAFAIGDNTDRRSYAPATLPDAVATAASLIAAGHSVDLGAAQISWRAGHLQARGFALSASFDACTSFRVGAEVLAGCYARTVGAEQQRLRAMASCYNTGTLDRGAAYAARVWRAAALVIPAIQIAGAIQAPATPEDIAAPSPRRPPPGLEDALHASSAVQDDQDGLGDAFNHNTRKDNP